MGRVNELNHFTRGQLDAALMKIGQDAGMSTANGIRAFLAGELVAQKPIRTWHEENGVIRFSVTSDGTTGEDWIARLESQGVCIGDHAKQLLRSSDFKPTSGVTTEVAVIKGLLFEDEDRISSKIRAQAKRRKLTTPNAELACLIRLKFTDKEIEQMGLAWIVAMHKLILDSLGLPHLLGAYRDGRLLHACYDKPGSRWNVDGGFAFVVSQSV